MRREPSTGQAESDDRADDRPVELLVVGTFGGGGIHQYIDEQVDRFSDGIAVSTFDMIAAPTGSGPGWFLTSTLRSLSAALRFPFRSRPDLVHVHASHRFSFYRAAFYVLFAAYVWQCPVVLHIHGSSFDEFARTSDQGVRLLQDLVFDAADRIVVLSEYWREVLSRRTDPEKLRVYPNAVDPDEYTPAYEADRPRIVFVSNLYERKGVATLVEALDALADDDPQFRAEIAGKGPLVDQVEALAQRHDAVRYHGYVSEQRKRELLEQGTIYVLPTHAEGLPIAMLEAMAGGNAIVSTTVGSIPEVIGDENGRLVEPGDTAALTEALSELIEAPEAVAEMGRRNRTLVETEYDWDSIQTRLERLYVEELLD
ncbi:glycosyltransferase family 4 protein [Halomicroarcula sp. GCM10025709]|uniref:glycosyltransferase family 4 protein n=1 Tax=Haloarcula TaxID=2237 RepID=UPI0024C27384|nr:glycosyltransferase family 4 protein [Halomicroarcula sp. YJ-61-S]